MVIYQQEEGANMDQEITRDGTTSLETALQIRKLSSVARELIVRENGNTSSAPIAVVPMPGKVSGTINTHTIAEMIRKFGTDH